jgi:DNA helicase-2/ATP-dependent DNA helicase PcrA
LIWWKHVPVERILWVTFTNKAANEMKERLVKLWDDIAAQDFSEEWKEEVKSDWKDDDLQDFISAMQSWSKYSSKFTLDPRRLKWIWTFHSIFLKILKEDIELLWKKFNKNFWILDADDSAKIIRDIIKRLNVQDLFKPQEVKWFISTQKNNWRTS